MKTVGFPAPVVVVYWLVAQTFLVFLVFLHDVIFNFIEVF